MTTAEETAILVICSSLPSSPTRCSVYSASTRRPSPHLRLLSPTSPSKPISPRRSISQQPLQTHYQEKDQVLVHPFSKTHFDARLENNFSALPWEFIFQQKWKRGSRDPKWENIFHGKFGRSNTLKVGIWVENGQLNRPLDPKVCSQNYHDHSRGKYIALT